MVYTSFGQEENGKTGFLQTNFFHSKTVLSPLATTKETLSKDDFVESIHEAYSYKTSTNEASQFDYVFSRYSSNLHENALKKKTLFCSFPIERVQTILSEYTTSISETNKMKGPRKILCLYCDRTFVNVNLRQKHFERCHSSKQLRRVSLRKNQSIIPNTACIYCDKFTSSERTLKDLFKHLIEDHSNKYFGCLPCEIRFLNSSHLADHNMLCHNMQTVTQKTASHFKPLSSLPRLKFQEEIPLKIPRQRQKTKESKMFFVKKPSVGLHSETPVKSSDVKNLRSKKLAVKSSRMILTRNKKLQTKLNDSLRKKQAKNFNEKKKSIRLEQGSNSRLSEKSNKATSDFVNPYPEFDNFFQVKKITDHSIDNLKISSLTFDDVFDKAFFNRIKCNIQENLMHHIDGKLFNNVESENRISNFEKNINVHQEMQNMNIENYGCELSLNAITPTTLLSNQLGDDPELQIEYASKPSKKKTQIKKNEVHYKYFTRRKYQASILERKENRDLSKLDMWTQYVIKNRQQKVMDDKKSPKEILDYFAGDEYKNIMKREELNRILDKRGPFEDLREEANRKAALEKLNSGDNSASNLHIAEIGDLLNDLLNRVFEMAKESYSAATTVNHCNEQNVPEIVSYLHLRPNSESAYEHEIDKSDKIALICSSQETENFELPSNVSRGKNEKVELTGEWARSRIYVCAACGLMLKNIKQFLEHKSANHQNIWVQHYEFVGTQSELYRHLSIPVLGKVGVLEDTVQCKMWKRSDARSCTKCGKQCNALGELHRHILECGGDWTWMLARKKCKYRPFGAKSRRKRRGLVKRIYMQKTEPTEKKITKKKFDLPRQKPSDADTIKRMLANLPPKRTSRKIMSLKDGFNIARNKQSKNQCKYKCRRVNRGKSHEQNTVLSRDYGKTNKQNNSYRRSSRTLNKVLTSRILDMNSSLVVKRKCNQNLKNEESEQQKEFINKTDIVSEICGTHSSKASVRTATQVNATLQTKIQNNKQLNELKFKRSSPRIEKRKQRSADADKINIKRYFPVRRKVINDKINLPNNKIQSSRPAESTENNKVQEKKNNYSQEIKNSHLNLRKRQNNKNLVLTNKSKRKFDKKGEARAVSNENKKGRENKKKTSGRNCLQRIRKKKFDEEGTSRSSSISEKGTPPVLEIEKTQKNPEKVEVNVTLEKIVAVEATASMFTIEKTKKKLRKPTRDLNDCIAMLTSKLESKNLVGNNYSKELPKTSVSEQRDASTFSECILKVPLSNEHFRLNFSDISKPVNNAVRDVKKNEVRTVEHENTDTDKKNHSCVQEQNRETYQNIDEEDNGSKYICQQINSHETEEATTILVKPNHDNHSERINPEKMQTSPALCEKQNDETDSEDEIPLSVLLKDESSNQTTSFTTGEKDNINSFDTSNFSENENIESMFCIQPLVLTEKCSGKEDYTSNNQDHQCVGSSDKKSFFEINDLSSGELQSLENNPTLPKENDILEDEVNSLLEENVGNVELSNISQDCLDTNLNEIQNQVCENKSEEKILLIGDLSRQDSADSDISHYLVDNSLMESTDSVEQTDCIGDILVENRTKSQNNVYEQTTENLEVLQDCSLTTDVPGDANESVAVISSSFKASALLQIEDAVINHRSSANLNIQLFENNEALDFQSTETKENIIQHKFTGKKEDRNAKGKTLESIFDDTLLELPENEFSHNLKSLSSNNVMDMDEASQIRHQPSGKSVKEKFKKVCTKKPEEIKNNKAEESTFLETNHKSVNCDVDKEPTLDKTVELHCQSGINSNARRTKELRRSSRNSRRVASYNETHLIDSLFDDLDSNKTISKIMRQTRKNIFCLKRKSHKFAKKKMSKHGMNKKDLNGDDLFDLLKATPNESNMLSLPGDTFFNSFNQNSNDFNSENFDTFEEILEGSPVALEENLSEQTLSNVKDHIPNTNKEMKTQNISGASIKSEMTREEGKNHQRKKYKTKINDREFSKQEPSENLTNNENEVKIDQNLEIVSNKTVDFHDVNQDNSVNIFNTDHNKDIYCEICDKTFSRMESLNKHKRTLTHISKLSELEAKEAAQKINLNQAKTNEAENISNRDLNILQLLAKETEEECTEVPSTDKNTSNCNLKLADLISDVLNKPILQKHESFHTTVIQSEVEPQTPLRKYKNLAERKSFDSETCVIDKNNDSDLKNIDYFETNISDVAPGTILEKQITLLENIIENRSALTCIDELSGSSIRSESENNSKIRMKNASKKVGRHSYSTQCERSEEKSNVEGSFLKPCEDTSEDSTPRSCDEQKLRKVLNRDEELFLECCSLLKSGSEVSSYSKKSNVVCNTFNKGETENHESEWLQNNCFSQKKSNFSSCCSDHSRIQTPLSDTFSQEGSNSASISSHWDMDISSSLINKENSRTSHLEVENASFDEVFNKKKSVFSERDDDESNSVIITSFQYTLPQLDPSHPHIENKINLEDVLKDSRENKEIKNSGVVDGRKILTKGAMKVFEGLKVSIPTEELNMDKLLIPALPKTKPESTTEFGAKDLENTRHLKPSKHNSGKQSKSTNLTKAKNATKTCSIKNQNNLEANSKIHDIYDFEETQDNSDIFTRPDFRSFRSNYDKNKKVEKQEQSDDSQDYFNAKSFDTVSSSTSSISETLPIESRSHHSITKKKCMIMGRIFKNALKSKIIDEDIRNVPELDNKRLVEDFVLSCPEPFITTMEKSAKFTEEQMNIEFDKLINTKTNECKGNVTKRCPSSQLNKRKPKSKCKKRSYGYIESSDDEFKLKKCSKKRHIKENGNSEDNCINLEQELRECIGVASRKSQRKCTSGKQNILMEYWSSDESSFESVFEKNIMELEENGNNKSRNNFITEVYFEKDKTNFSKCKYSDLDTNSCQKRSSSPTSAVKRRKRVAVNPLYHWSSSSEDESRDLIEIGSLRDEIEDDEDRPVQHGWIVGDSPKKLVTMLAQAKGKKCEVDSVKECGKKRTNTFS